MLVNWQQEEPNGCGGGRELFMNGTSRVNREVYARFCERPGVKSPGPTRRGQSPRTRFFDYGSRAISHISATRIAMSMATWLGGMPHSRRWTSRSKIPRAVETA